MRKFAIAFGIAASLVSSVPANAQEWRFEAPKLVCAEDMPCWRAWMGDGEVGPNAPAYMFFPEGAVFDALAPMFGYRAEV